MNSSYILLTVGALAINIKRRRYEYRQRIHIKKKIAQLLRLYYQLKENEKSYRRFWVRSIFSLEKRMKYGHSNNLLMEMRLNDHEKYFNFLRMTPSMFDRLLSIIGPNITRSNDVRDSIPAKTRLEITLRYLADGLSMTSCSYDFRVGKNTVSVIISETCQVIWDCLRHTVFPQITVDNWKAVASDFENIWNFKNCIGAIDGKHVIIQAPPHSGSEYYNYKNSHSINLMAIANARSQFIMVDIGAQGRLSDGGIFRESTIGRRLENKQFDLPEPTYISELDDYLPFVLIGDEAFALSTYMMRPYPRSGVLDRRRKIFNYRLSRARRMVESAFGILAARWRIFRKPITASISTTIKIVQATICLHNYIMQQEELVPSHHRRYSTLTREDRQLPTQALRDITHSGSNTYSRNAAHIRNVFAEYFERIDVMEYQWTRILQNDF